MGLLGELAVAYDDLNGTSLGGCDERKEIIPNSKHVLKI